MGCCLNSPNNFVLYFAEFYGPIMLSLGVLMDLCEC